jgi:hypothetical protein
MQLIDNAGHLWHRFWSLRLAALAAVLSGATVAATMALPEHTSLRVALLMGMLTAAAAIASALARVVKQPGAQAAAAGAELPSDPIHQDVLRQLAIEQIRALMAAHDLTVDDIFRGAQ